MNAAAVTVLTLAKGRDDHLRNLLAGLARGTRLPERCIVVRLDQHPAPLPACPFEVIAHKLPSQGLPLAKARNAAAALATTPLLIFLDVDCIPAADLVESLAADAAAEDALICCEVLYLPPGPIGAATPEADLRSAGLRHPVRVFPETGLRPESNAGLFWSLAFAVRRATFTRLGGFDEAFSGYGAEDTDFAFRARDAGVPLLFTAGTVAFHQHHDVHDPPVQHFASIIANAERFRARHGLWPMQGWLDGFVALGFIAPPGADGRLGILRHPNAADIAATRRPGAPY